MNKTLYLPISQVCSSAIALRELEVRETAYTFDWTGQSYQTTADIIDNGVDDTFNDYEKFIPKYEFECVIWEKKYNLLLMHEKDEPISNVKDKYIRRYKRMIKDLKTSKEVFLVPNASDDGKLYDLWIMFKDSFKEQIPSREEINAGSIETVKEAILRVNPNIKITVPKIGTWEEMFKEIKQHKGMLNFL